MSERLSTRFFAREADGGEFPAAKTARIITNIAEKFPPDAIVTMGRDPIEGRYVEIRRRDRPLLRALPGGNPA